MPSVRCTSAPLILPLGVLFAALALTQEALPESGEVKIDLMIGPNLSVSGGETMNWSEYSFPDFSSAGTGIFKSYFLETEGDLPRGGYAFLEWTGSNSAKLLLRDLDLDYDTLRYAPFSSTIEGLFYGATHDDEQQSSIYHRVGNRIEHEGNLLIASDNGTVIFNDIFEGFGANISRIRPDGTKELTARHDEPVPGLEGVTFKGLYRVHANPNGGVAFAATLEGTGVDFNNDWALFRTDSQGSSTSIVREGDAHPADSRLAADGIFIDLAFNQTGFGFNGTGATSFTALITDPNPQGFTAASTLWYVPSESNAPSLVAVSGSPTETANDGTITFNSFTYNADGALIPPMVDANGSIIFLGTLLDGLDVSRPAVWKWSNGTLTKVIDLDNLPFDEVENKTVTISDVGLSSRGRIALFGVVDGLSQVIWAQDDQGNFANVITRNPFSNTTYSNQNLVLKDGSDLGKVSRLSPPVGSYNDASGGEDGLTPKWWTPEEKLMFTVEVSGGEINKPFICQATVGKGVEIPAGNRYIWDGALGTTNWHSIENSETNWVDANGVRWDKPPSTANAVVSIPEGHFVEILQAIDQIASLDSKGSLELFANMNVSEQTNLKDLTVRGESQLISAGEVIANGDILGGESGIRVIGPLANTPITTKGNITAVDAGIWVTAPNGIDLDNGAEVSAISGTAIIATSVSGDIAIDNRGAITAGQGHGIVATSETGAINIATSRLGEAATSISAVGIGIKAMTSGDIDIDSRTEITTIGGLSQAASSDGIFADSTGGAVSIVQRGNIATSFTSTSPAISARSASSLTIDSAGEFSTLFGIGIYAESENGSVDITHDGSLVASQNGGGIKALAENGSIIINGENPDGEISAAGDFSTGDGIQATARDSVSIFWLADVSTFGSQGASAIHARSTNGGVSVTTKGNVSAFGSSSYGAVLSGPSKLTLTILSGSIGGGDGIGAAIVFAEGTENLISNHGAIDAYSFNAIQTSTGNETIDNYGRISGDIDLGDGTNLFENHAGASLTTHNDLKLGEGNSLKNSGELQIGELGRPTRTTTMIGNLVMAPSASMRMEIEDTTIAGDPIADKLVVNGDAQIDGELIVHLQETYDQPKDGDSFILLTANSLTGVFSNVRVLGRSHPDAEVSRKVSLELSYTETTISGTTSVFNIDSYATWKARYFDEAQQNDKAVSGPDADFDGDGISNGDEALFGGSPLVPNASPVSFEFTNLDESDAISVSATFNVANDLPDREWFFETTQNLRDWEPANLTVTAEQDFGDYSKLTVTFDLSVQIAGEAYARLRSRSTSL